MFCFMSANPNSKTTSAVIDRIEDGGWAIVAFQGEGESRQSDMPKFALPDAAQDGSHLTITTSIGADNDSARLEWLNKHLREVDVQQDAAGCLRFSTRIGSWHSDIRGAVDEAVAVEGER